MAEGAMSAFLTNIGLVVTQIITWVGNVAGLIVQTPLFLFTTAFVAIGGAIGIMGRILSKN